MLAQYLSEADRELSRKVDNTLYEIHVLTTNIFRGLSSSGNVSLHADLESELSNPQQSTNPTLTFRACPQYRSDSALAMRKSVADIIRTYRKENTLKSALAGVKSQIQGDQPWRYE